MVFQHGNMQHTIGHVKNMDFQDRFHKHSTTALEIYLLTFQKLSPLVFLYNHVHLLFVSNYTKTYQKSVIAVNGLQ